MGKSNSERRKFLKLFGLSSIPLMVPSIVLGNTPSKKEEHLDFKRESDNTFVNFISDGLMLSPQERIQKLSNINNISKIEQDVYGNGGTILKLEEAFAKITGKEKAIFVPTGTMANQLAIKLLNENNTKVIVPENSHVFRDEADAAQSVHNQRLIPAGKGKSFFNATDLKDTIDYYNSGEVFKSGLGTVVVEHPVRRADGAALPLDIIKSISKYSKEKGYKLHLDGARIHLASAFTGISIAEYTSHFDTVYISLYKYLNASTGAILCGDAKLIDKMKHQIKILGGTTYQNWNSSAMALHYLNGIENRWQKIVQKADQLISELNKIDGISISKIENGTNIFNLNLDTRVNIQNFREALSKNYNIGLRGADANRVIKFSINESLSRQKNNTIVNAFKKAITA